MTSNNEPSPDVPLFLRKTYHMIDTCDPDIASWSDDGETFVVKDPIQFEQTIIPQFFKHSKFSSFVRQLNFYSFRKIKYSDTLRIDPKLEAETANYWRFKHESFQRGKPHLLSKIKRMHNNNTAATSAGGAGTANSNGNASKQLQQVANSSKQVVTSSVTSEVQTLKKKIEEMTKNIDELTAMVKEVSLKQEEHQQEDTTTITSSGGNTAGYKRKKVDYYHQFQDDDDEDVVRPDEMISSMDLDDVIALPVASMMVPPPVLPERMAAVRENSNTSSATPISDLEFVDSLFTAFNDEDVFVLDDDEEIPLLQQQQQQSERPSYTKPGYCTCADVNNNNSNLPDADLMKRLSDALMLLPKDTQEMIVNRLIAAITSTDFIASHTSSCGGGASCSSKVGKEHQPPIEEEVVPAAAPFPLAAATLAALLRHYTSQVQHHHGKSSSGVTTTASNKSGAVEKSIPVIPVHA